MSYYRSSCSYRVRIGLNLKGLAYELSTVHLVKDGGEQFSAQFSNLNPSQKVPVLIDGNRSLSQSVAIFDYLETLEAGTPLWPADPFEKSQLLQMVEMIISDIQPLQNLRVLKHLVKTYSLETEAKEDWIRHWIEMGFEALEALVKKTSANGEFSFGSAPSVLDCFLVPQVYNALRFSVDMNRYPTLKSANDHCVKLKPFVDAHPDNQPDAP